MEKIINYFESLRHEKLSIKKVLLYCVFGTVGAVLGGMILFTLAIAILSLGLPDVTKLENLAAAQSTEIVDRDGELLYTVHGEENREYIEYENISKHIVDATVAIEDDQFWAHKGFDLEGIFKAGIYEIFGIGSKRGGSTITQQYVKNTFLNPKRSYTRKLKELILAVRLEQAYGKEKIIELYINRIPYGNNAYGVQKAAEVYFGKDAKDLTLAESAVLVALPQAPSYYNPYGQHRYSTITKTFTEEELDWRNIEEEEDLEDSEFLRGLIGATIELGPEHKIYVKGRVDLVLNRMLELDMIKEEEKQEAWAKTQEIEFNEYRDPIKAPHFVLWIKEQLEEKYGKDIVEQGGLKVTTTLDWKLQEAAEKAVENQAQNNEDWYNATNASLVSIDANNGHIIAMVGSRDYFDEEIDGKVNVSLRPRQPGSSFKPIVYAQAFLNRYSPASVIYDVPTKFGPDEPNNYDGEFRGPMTIRRALGQSRNIPAAKTYFLAGRQDIIIDLAEAMGITSLDRNASYGWPLALGVGEVPLIEMVRAYSVFANGGNKHKLVSVLKVENNLGEVLEEWKEEDLKKTVEKEVLDPQVAYLINSILSDTNVNLGNLLSIGGHIMAAKTGTSNKKIEEGNKILPNNALAFGYTTDIVTGVWAGNADGTAMKGSAAGYTCAAPIMNEFMRAALADKESKPFNMPDEIRTKAVSTATGLLPGKNTPKDKIAEDVFASFAVPEEIEDVYVEIEVDTSCDDKLASEWSPEEAVKLRKFQRHKAIEPYPTWQSGINKWVASEKAKEMGIDPPPPTETCEKYSEETFKNKPEISIVSPAANGEIGTGKVPVEVNIDAKNGVKKVEFYFDDKLNFSTSKAPYIGEVRVSNLHKSGSKHLIMVRVVDKIGYDAQSVINVKIEE
ncbi:MAG: penicillin-binding protein [Patescibacteria group bacterium]